MRISENRLKMMCLERGVTISELLERAGVSRNAFYTLARRKNILPGTITSIAQTLNISPSEFLEIDPSPSERAQKLFDEVEYIRKKHKGIDRDNVRHTLQLLDEEPVDRLRRALTRAQRFNFQ